MCQECQGILQKVINTNFMKCNSCNAVFRVVKNGLKYYGECGGDCVCEYQCLLAVISG